MATECPQHWEVRENVCQECSFDQQNPAPTLGKACSPLSCTVNDTVKEQIKDHQCVPCDPLSQNLVNGVCVALDCPSTSFPNGKFGCDPCPL